MTTVRSIEHFELRDAELAFVNGGIKVSVCAFGYCASVGTDGISVGKEGGESIGTQVYNAVMAGMNSVTHA